MKKLFIIFAAGALVSFTAACSNNEISNTTTVTTTNTATANRAAEQSATASTATTPTAGTGGASDETPAAVRAALPGAQSFTTQRKDIPAAVISTIEKETGIKVAGKDHRSYLAFTTTGGARRQVGAATIIEANGKEMVAIYDSKGGSPVIREVRDSTLPAAFLDQFKGKGHDDALTFGKDIKAAGASETAAKAATAHIKSNVLAMQALYGSEHTH